MRISGFVVAAAVGIVLSLAGLVTFVSLGVHSVGCRDRKKLNDQAPSKTTSLRARRMSSQDTTSPSVPPLMPPLVTPPSSWPPPPLGPPVAPEQCPESMVSCADLASLTDVWQALGSELRDSGSVGLWRFMDAVNQMSSVAPDSPFLKQVLSQDMDIRTRAINNSLWKDDDSSGLPVIPASEHPSITLHDFLQRFPDRDYSLNTLMWVFRNVVLNCILISEVVINDNYAADNLGPAYATFLLTATEDTDLTNKFYLQSASTTASTLNKSLVVNGLCSLPATCAPKLRLRAAEAMASILSVSIPLKQHVDDEWTSDGHTGQFPSTCNHAMCCTGVGIFPPPAPPAPPPAPPSPSSPPPPPTPPPFPPHDSGAESCPVCECRAANAGPSSARCGGSGLTGFDCHRCGTDAGCSRFMGVSGRCDDGVVAAAWAKGETHKGLDCLAGGDLARASASCRVRGSEQGWNDQGRASGNCTVGVQVGEGIFLSCFADGCAFRTGESSVVCDQVQCDEDLSGGRQTDVAAKAYAESVSGRVAVDCNVRTDGSAVCELDVGSLPVAIQAECTASRCMDASRARPSPQTVLARLGEKSVEELCKDEARSLFPPLSIAATLFSVGIVLLFSACGYRKSLSRMQAASDTQKAARLASWMSPKDTHQKTASGSEHPSADGAVIPDLQRPQDTVPSLDRLAELVQQLRRVDDAPILGWTRLSVNVVDGVCANRAPRPESGIRGAVLGLHWKRVGVSKPAMCTVLSHEALAVALATKTEFTQAEFDSLKVPPLRSDNCILVRGEYFRPAGAPRRAVVEECSAELCLSNGDQGAVTALMGPSGSGKTSLLHAVTGIPTAGLRQRGDVHLGGVSVTTLPRGIISLVPQDAVLPEELCAREALMFASALSLPSAPLKDRSAIVDETLSNLLLRDVASHTIGGRLAGGGGLSGGERKRVSIGLSIVTCPQVLLLDEPSSGLDAYTAFLLGDLIKKLAEKSKRVVLVSVHQPSSQLFELFHGLLLLAEGKCIYHGPPLDAVPSLSRATSHFPPQPEGIAPADHLLHVLVRHLDRVCPVEPIKSRGSERSNSYSRMKRMSVSVVVLGRPSVNPHRFSWPRQCYWLGWRCIVQLCREPSLLLTQMVVHVGVALLMGYAFLQVESDIAGFQNKAGSISFMLYFFAIGGLSTAQTVTREWPLLWAEYHEGLYSAVPYAVTRLLIEVVLLRVLPSVAFSGIFYALAGFRREFVALVRFLFAAALASADSALVSAAISVCLPRRPGAASMISVVVLFMFLLVSGLQINLNKVPDGLRWLPAISFGRHAFEIMLSTELDGEDVRVEVPGAPPVDVKADIVLGVIGLNASRTSQNFLALCAIGVILVALTSGVLVLQMEPWLNHVRKTQAEAATRRSLEPPSLSRSATSASVVSAVSEESHVRGVSLSLEEAGISVSLDEDASLLLEEPAHDEDAPAKEARAAASEPLFSLSLEQRAAVLLEEPAYESAVLPVE